MKSFRIDVRAVYLGFCDRSSSECNDGMVSVCSCGRLLTREVLTVTSMSSSQMRPREL